MAYPGGCRVAVCGIFSEIGAIIGDAFGRSSMTEKRGRDATHKKGRSDPDRCLGVLFVKVNKTAFGILFSGLKKSTGFAFDLRYWI